MRSSLLLALAATTANGASAINLTGSDRAIAHLRINREAPGIQAGLLHADLPKKNSLPKVPCNTYAIASMLTIPLSK